MSYNEDSMVDIRIPGHIRIPDMIVEAILFLFGKAGFPCKITIMPLTRYSNPYTPSPSPQPYTPSPYVKPLDYKWGEWANDNTTFPGSPASRRISLKKWFNSNDNSTAGKIK